MNKQPLKMSTQTSKAKRPQSLEELRAAALNIVLVAEDIAAGADEIKRRAMCGGWKDEESAYRTLIRIWSRSLSLPQPPEQ